MSPEDQNRAIAESVGWREAFPKSGEPHPETKRGGILLPYNWVNERTHDRANTLPDYLNDLNAMHKAEKELAGPTDDDESQRAKYSENLVFVCAGNQEPMDIWYWDHIHITATAAQRAEAYLRCIGKWKE